MVYSLNYSIIDSKFIMKIYTAILFSLLVVILYACSDQQPSSKSKASATESKNQILEPADEIKNSVIDQLQQGRWELVMFWATYCHICKKDFERLAGFIEENPDIPLTIIGVVVDGIEEKQKALSQISGRKLDYTHVLTDFKHSSELYEDISKTKLVGVPSQLLYNTNNDLVGFSHNAIDLDALEIVVYE